MSMRPAARPRLSLAELKARVEAAHPGHDFAGKLTVVGIRGYYRDTMGAAGRNDRGIYDDALFVVSDNAFVAFNGNTDPSRVRKGAGRGAGKGMAVLKPGLYRAHRFDLHKGQYLALCQRAAQVTVIRDGEPPYPDTGMFGINIHRGGNTTTSSEGCQTIPPDQWPAFIALCQAEAKRIYGADWRAEIVTYILLEEA